MVAVAQEPEKVNIYRPEPLFAPSLAAGTELLGEYEASAFNQPQYLLRRPDGQVIQVTLLLYLLSSCLDQHDHVADVAADLSARFGRLVSAGNVNYLIDNKLRPLGVIEAGAGSDPLTRSTPLLLGLRFRTRVVPERLHRGASWALQPLFWPPLVLAVLGAFGGLDVWLAVTATSRILSGVQQAILRPDLLLVVIAISIAVGAFHEVGHAAAARYGGANAGVMGVGIYLMLPVFYTDVTDSYRLSRRGRLRTDLGGLYFNVIAILICAGIYQATHFIPLLVFIGVSQLEMLYQFLPFVRMDGYYVVSDLIGVPNLFAFVGPTISRLLRRHDTAARARLGLLKARARAAIIVWVALTVPILAFNIAVVAFFTPRIFPAMWTSVQTQARGISRAVATGNFIGGLNHLTELVLVAVPSVGMVLVVGMVLRRIVPAITRLASTPLARASQWISRWRHRQAFAVFATVALAVGLVPLGLLVNRNIQAPDHSPSPAIGAPTPTKAPAVDVGSSAVTFTSVGGSGMTSTPDGEGYWLVKGEGGVFSFGNAAFYGSLANTRLNQPAVAITSTPDGGGYWLAAADGGVFTFGDAGFYGSLANTQLNQPVVAITPTPTGRGYWLAAADGGVFTFGDAGFYGSQANTQLNQPVVAITPTPTGRGYWLAAGDGGVFTFGDATFSGSAAAGRHPAPVTGIIVTGSLTNGAAIPRTTYQLIGANGLIVPRPDTG